MSRRTVFITGCSSGFGLGAAQAFLARGWEVIAALREPAGAPTGLAGARLVRLDMADTQQIAGAAGAIGELDCLVNNAGYALAGPFAGYRTDQMQRQLQVNLLGPILLTQALLPALKRKRGRIINISSMAGENGMPMQSLYCASKHALEGWSESLRHELQPHGVQVALLEPGGFRTRFGRNLEWHASEAALDEIDRRQLAEFRALRERLLAGEGRNPAPVVQAIVKLAEMDAMPLRMRVGADARALRFLRRALPENIALKMIGDMFRRHMSGPGKP